MTSKNHSRAPGMTQISISLPQDLVAKLDALAAQENRNRSNYIVTLLEQTINYHPTPETKITKTLAVSAYPTTITSSLNRDFPLNP